MLWRPDFAAVVAEITTHKNEGIRVCGRSCKAAEMADGLAGDVEEIERAITEEIKCSEMSNLYAVILVEVDFAQCSSTVLI